jgi:hypothetical protein
MDGLIRIKEGKQLSVEAAITGQQAGRLCLGMRADQEIRKIPASLTALSLIRPPRAAR